MTQRIASLLASATEIVAALGLADRLVAISHECDHPAEVLDRPRVSRLLFDPTSLDSGAIDRAVRATLAEFGSVYEIDASTLASLDPDLILTQAVCDVCAVPTAGVRDVVAAAGLRSRIESLDAHMLADILRSIEQVAGAAGVPQRGRQVVTALEARLAAVASLPAIARRPRVLALEWLDPPFAPGHWVPEMIELAGGENLLGRPGERSREVAWSELADLDPDVLLVMPCGYDVAAARVDADRQASRLIEVAPRAVATGRAFLVDASSYINRSGPRVVDGVEILASLLRGAEPDGETAARWQA